mgnify:FL=1
MQGNARWENQPLVRLRKEDNLQFSVFYCIFSMIFDNKLWS